MRNFYNQPTNKIFDKMFGNGPRQLQPDPTLDLTKCKCCQCDAVECKGCIEGHFLKSPEVTQDQLDNGMMYADGCCHGPENGLIFEYERPGSRNYGPECCPNVQSPCCAPGQQNCFDLEGNPLPPCGPNVPLGIRRCCGIRETPASNVRFYYNYAGKYFKMDYAATGKYNTVWPANGRPRLCSTCDLPSLDAARRLTYHPEARETCLDYMGDAAIDDRVNINVSTCSTIDIPFAGCQCMGSGLLEDQNNESKRLSYHRKREMERLPYYRWLLDIMCYDGGNVVSNPYYRYREGQAVPVNNNGTLYEHLLAVVHCEHWYELSFCDENPEHGDGAYLGAGMTDSANPPNPIQVNTSKLAPRFWLYACSGVPFFDFELEEAREKAFISQDEYQEILRNFDEGKTPRQEIMKNLAKGGYFDTGDWRQEALSELTELRKRKFTAGAYGGIPDGDPNFGACCVTDKDGFVLCLNGVTAEYCAFTGGNFFPTLNCDSQVCTSRFCSQLDFLGPVRKRLWKDNINVTGLTGPGRLDPRKARSNTVSPPLGTIIEEVINSTEDSTLRRIQLPASLIRDPWNGVYPIDPGPGATGDVRQEWEDFKFWRDAQWLYMHARPGGWDYVCSGYQNPQNPDPDLRIPDLPRRFSNIPGAIASAGCLDGLLGIPVDEKERTGGCQTEECGYVDPVTNQFVNYPLVGCDYAAQSCLGIDCPYDPTFYCSQNPEEGGGPTYCRNISMASSCKGIRFTYTKYKLKTLYAPSIQDNESYYVCDKKVNAFLYRVNLTKGNYDSFCPFQCRTVQIPKPIERAIPVLSTNRATYRLACDSYYYKPAPLTPIDLCDGVYCFGRIPNIDPSTGVPPPSPGTYGGAIPYSPFLEPNCCRKNRTPRIFTPSPQDPTHDASNRQECPLYPGPGYPQIYDGQFVGINYETNPWGCCWKCSLAGATGECLGRMTEFACRTRPENDGVNYTTIHKTEILNDCCTVDYDCGCSTNYAQDCTGYN